MLKSILVTQPLVATCYSRHTMQGFADDGCDDDFRCVFDDFRWVFDDFDDDPRWIYDDCNDDFRWVFDDFDVDFR